MPSFDISSEMEWQTLDDVVNVANKEVLNRYDFKGIKTEMTLDKKAKTLTFWISEPTKLAALREIFDSKAVKRGLSPLAFDPGKVETAHGGSSRQVMKVMAGIEKEKAKEIIAVIKDSKLKVQAQIQDEKVRVTGKNRDDLQECIALLRGQIDKLKVPMQFGNFRE
jgi:uncharacterized protein YajQ (UPF0234 family)